MTKRALVIQAGAQTPFAQGFPGRPRQHRQRFYIKMIVRTECKTSIRKMLLKSKKHFQLLILATIFTAVMSVAVQARAQSKAVIHKDTYWQARPACQIRSPIYTGGCSLTVISFGKSMNIHFDIDDLGSRGLSFGGNKFITSSHGAVLEVLGVVGRFSGEDSQEYVSGECTVDFSEIYDPRKKTKPPWKSTARIVCISQDGRFNAVAE